MLTHSPVIIALLKGGEKLKRAIFCILSTLKYFNTKKTLHTSALTSADCHLRQLQGFIMLQCQHLSNGNFIYSARSKTMKKKKTRLIPLSTILNLTLPRENNRNILSALETNALFWFLQPWMDGDKSRDHLSGWRSGAGNWSQWVTVSAFAFSLL